MFEWVVGEIPNEVLLYQRPQMIFGCGALQKHHNPKRRRKINMLINNWSTLLILARMYFCSARVCLYGVVAEIPNRVLFFQQLPVVFECGALWKHHYPNRRRKINMLINNWLTLLILTRIYVCSAHARLKKVVGEIPNEMLFYERPSIFVGFGAPEKHNNLT